MKLKFVLMFSGFVFALACGDIQGKSVAITHVTGSAVIPENTNFKIQLKEDGTQSAAVSMTWPAQIVGSGWQKSLQVVEITVQSNLRSWRVDVYTDNVAADTNLNQKGGLISFTDNSKRLVLGWVVSGEPIPDLSVGLPGELITNRVKGSTSSVAAPWRYLKDKGDQDDVNTTEFNESWGESYKGKYTAIIFGGPNYMLLPYQSLWSKSTIYLYLEGDFSSSEGAMNYTGTLHFDFIGQ